MSMEFLSILMKMYAVFPFIKMSMVLPFRKAMQHQLQGHLMLPGDNGFLNGGFVPAIDGPLIIENGVSVTETDFSVNCIIESPSKMTKRVYAQVTIS
jgi:hypothetical protein